jgi:hypothetical protein
MTRSNPFRPTSLFALLLLGAMPALAQDRLPVALDHDTSWVEIDQATRTARLRSVRRGSVQIVSTPIRPEGEFRIHPGDSTAIRVVNTNSALYTCTLAQTRTTVPEIEQTKGFLTAMQPYLTAASPISDFDVLLGISGFRGDMMEERISRTKRSGDNELRAARTAVIEQLGRIRESTAEMNRVRGTTLGVLHRMHEPRADVAALSQTYRRSLGCEDCKRQAFVAAIVGNVETFIPTANLLEALVRDPNRTPSDEDEEVAASAQKVMENVDALLAAAYATERLTGLVAHASPQVECENVEVSRTAGRDLTITVAPRALSETQRIADRPSLELKAKALPRFRVAPFAGLSLLYAPDAVYDKFGTVKAPGDSAEIIESGSQNSRWTYGLTLGARLDGVVRARNVSIYLPELTINPSDDVKAIGLGGSVSVSAIKVGVGALWTRHQRLGGEQRVGQRLRDAAFLNTEDRYDGLGSPNLYISFSVVGWPPFLGGGGGDEKK